MRIIAGKRRGMQLLGPATNDTRPITDRVKEALFSILYKYDVIEDGKIADLFCGTGSMGLESISRGAASTTFIEKSPKVAARLKKNIDKAQFNDHAKVICGNVFKLGAPVAPGEDKYTLAFVDPPYVMCNDTSLDSQVGKLLVFISQGQLADGAIASLRTHKTSDFLQSYGNLTQIDRRVWGNMAITLFQQKTGDDTLDQ